MMTVTLVVLLSGDIAVTNNSLYREGTSRMLEQVHVETIHAWNMLGLAYKLPAILDLQKKSVY